MSDNPNPDFNSTYAYFLGRDVPDWETVNKDPKFMEFCNSPDPVNPAASRLESIRSAHGANDYTTVIGHFLDFKRSRGESHPDPPAAPGVTPGDIKNFYEDAQAGKWGPISGDKYLQEEARLLSALGLRK